MTDVNEITGLWRRQSQQPIVTQTVRRLDQECRRAVRWRHLAGNSGIGVAALTLLLLALAGSATLTGSPYGQAPAMRGVMTIQLTGIALLLFFVFRIAVERSPSRVGSDLRESLDVARRAIEGEMQDFRITACIGSLVFAAVSVISLVKGRSSGALPSNPSLTRATPFLIAHFLAWLIAWRYHEDVLRRRRRELDALLADLTADPA